MTLKEWNDKFGIYKGIHTVNSRVCVHADSTVPNYSELWNLSDYAVESISGGVVWFRSINGETYQQEKVDIEIMKLPSNISSVELEQICEYIKFLEVRIKTLEEQILPKIEAVNPVENVFYTSKHSQRDLEICISCGQLLDVISNRCLSCECDRFIELTDEDMDAMHDAIDEAFPPKKYM